MLTAIRRIVVYPLFGVLVACQTPVATKQQVDVTTLLHDAVFYTAGQELVLEAAPDFLELPDQYKRQLDRLIGDDLSEYERYRRLRRWIYRNFEDFDFDVTETASLAELNANRKINCLSFSTLFVAAARYIDVPADFQIVFAPPYWDAENGSWVNNQHINVSGTLERPAGNSAAIYRPLSGFPIFMRSSHRMTWERISTTGRENQYRYTLDINPAIVSVPLRRKVLNEQQVFSLYHSNKSIEALLDNDLALAYAYSKQALLIDSASAVAWTNLGVLYSKAGALEFAQEAYQQAIALDQYAYSAKSNLASLYRSLGQIQLAESLEVEVESFRNSNPYYHSALAEESIAQGRYFLALDQLKTAVSHKHNEYHFYHQLAIVNQKIGDRDAVLENLIYARRYARGAEKARFSGKVKAFAELVAASR